MHYRYFVLVVMFLSCTFLGGCATADFALSGARYTEFTGVVQVMYAPPSCAYDVVGIVSGLGGMDCQAPTIIRAMQKKAAKYGANAIVLGDVSSWNQTTITATPAFGLYGGSVPRTGISGVAIRIKEDAP